MPLIEQTATVDTACVSTAPVFGRGESSPSDDGAPKRPDPGWWALVHHNSGAPGNGGCTQTALWCAWLAALLATASIPHAHFFTFMAAVCALVALVLFLPDDGATVLPYYIHLILPVIAYKSALFGSHWSFSMIYFIFGIVPIFDYVLGVDVANQRKADQKQLHRAFRFKLFTFLVPVCVAGVIVGGAWFVTRHARHLTALEFVGFSLSVGVYTGAIGIVGAHELSHKANWFERLLGRFLMCAACYGHFYVEHTMGHHKDVCTDKDAATARYGENFYAFLPRVIVGEFRSACEIEAHRLRKKGLPWWRNEIPMYFAATGLLCLGLHWGFPGEARGAGGYAAVKFFALQATMAVLLFESVNYLEHYGLERRLNADGKTHETVKPQHSWDSPARLTNMVTIKLQRHADHHAHAGKRFQTLQAYEESPQLPSGYATMILLAFIPPLWRYVMHPRLMRFRATQTGQKWRHGPQPEYAVETQKKDE